MRLPSVTSRQRSLPSRAERDVTRPTRGHVFHLLFRRGSPAPTTQRAWDPRSLQGTPDRLGRYGGGLTASLIAVCGTSLPRPSARTAPGWLHRRRLGFASPLHPVLLRPSSVSSHSPRKLLPHADVVDGRRCPMREKSATRVDHGRVGYGQRVDCVASPSHRESLCLDHRSDALFMYWSRLRE